MRMFRATSIGRMTALAVFGVVFSAAGHAQVDSDETLYTVAVKCPADKDDTVERVARNRKGQETKLVLQQHAGTLPYVAFYEREPDKEFRLRFEYDLAIGRDKEAELLALAYRA